MTLETALKATVPFGKNRGRTMRSLSLPQLKWYAENLEGPTGDAALLVYEARTKEQNQHEPSVRVWGSRPSASLTIEAQAFGELKSILENAPKDLF